MNRVNTVVLLLLGGCIFRRTPLAWQTVDIKNTSKEPQIYTLNISIIPTRKVYSVEVPFCVEYRGRWGLISTNWYGEQVAMDVNDLVLRFPYAQVSEWVKHLLPAHLFYGTLRVPSDWPNEKQGLICVARQSPGVKVSRSNPAQDTLYEVPAIFPCHKDAKGNTTAVIRIVLWPNCTAKFKVNVDCEMYIDSIFTNAMLIATHEAVLLNRK